jgi:hypothetical protein
MIERFGKAIGFRFPLWGNGQIELWCCPRGTVVPPHIHLTIDSFIIYLFGRMRVTVGNTTRDVCGPFRRRESTGKFTWAVRYIPAGARHCAEVLGSFAVFLNVERCHCGRISAARDFVHVP